LLYERILGIKKSTPHEGVSEKRVVQLTALPFYSAVEPFSRVRHYTRGFSSNLFFCNCCVAVYKLFQDPHSYGMALVVHLQPVEACVVGEHLQDG